MEPKIPVTLAGYKVLRVLGRGAGSFVYEAKDAVGARVALKHTPRNKPEDDRHVQQAIHEYNIAKLFDHDNIRRVEKLISTRSMGSVKDMIRNRSPLVTNDVVVVMEMVEGETLEQHPIHDLLKVCRMFLEVAHGLQAMHEAGYVHADLKPANIMFTKQGKAKLIDLGLACKEGLIRQRIHGTRGFIAPEQAIRQPVTHLSDVFSFGATMYNMLTKHFVPTVLKVHATADAPAATMNAKGEFPSARDLNPAVPPALSSLIMQCVRRKPKERPEKMADVHARLWMSITQIERGLDGGTGGAGGGGGGSGTPTTDENEDSRSGESMNGEELGIPSPPLIG